MLNDGLRSLVDLLGGDPLVTGVAAALFALAAASFIVERVFLAKKDVQRRIRGDKPRTGASIRDRMDTTLATIGSRVGGDGPSADVKVLRGKLIRAGYHAPRAVLVFFAVRLLCAALLAVCAAAGLLLWTHMSGRMVALSVAATSVIGYLGPSLILDRLVERNVSEHRNGFPDMMDLMVVCAQAGLSMEAGMQRIALEIAPAYPSLGRNLEWAVREIRSGKPLSRAIESLALRLGIEEAMSFSTLLQQSEELGSSLTQSLRAYSEDMRHKRMMKAEEKAYALPAKMVVPLTVFVFPVLIVVIMLPVVISVMAVRG